MSATERVRPGIESSVSSVVAVTPGGHAPERWEPRISAAESVDVAALLTRFSARSGGPAGSSSRVGSGVATGARLVVCAAHPDDETLGAGRLIHAWARATGPVRAVLASGGEACFDQVGPRPPGLVERRLAEWRSALSLLGAEPAGLLHLGDGQVADGEDVLVDALTALIATSDEGSAQPDAATVLAAPWRHDPHPDHRAVGRAAARVAARTGCALVEYPVWMTYWSDPDDADVARIELLRLRCDEADDLAHARACREFHSQLEPIRPDLGPVVPPEMLAHQRRQLLILTGDDHD